MEGNDALSARVCETRSAPYALTDFLIAYFAGRPAPADVLQVVFQACLDEPGALASLDPLLTYHGLTALAEAGYTLQAGDDPLVMPIPKH